MDVDKANKLIAEAASQLVSRLIESRGHDTPPFSPEEYARLLGMKIVKANLGKVNAALVESGEGYIIRVNESDIPTRQRFSCAHEIGHVLFNQVGLETHVRTIEYRSTFDPSGTNRVRAMARERLCDVAATKLLMPDGIFKKYLTSLGVSLHAIETLSNIFQTSITATAIRVAEISPEQCMVSLWNPWAKSKSKGLRFAWRAGPGEKPKVKGLFEPLTKYERSSSSLYRAYEQDVLVKSIKSFRLETEVKRLPVESKGFGRGDSRFVVSLAFVDRGKPPVPEVGVR